MTSVSTWICLLAAAAHPLFVEAVVRAIASFGSPSSIGPYGNIYRFCVFGISSAVTSVVLFGLLVRLFDRLPSRLLGVACAFTFLYFYLWSLVQKGWLQTYAQFSYSPMWNTAFALFIILLPWLVGRYVIPWLNRRLKPIL